MHNGCVPDALPHVLVSVCKGSECCDRGADGLHEDLRARVAESGLGPRVRVTRGGCWGFCNLGPNVVVRHDAAAAAVERNTFGGDASFQGKVGEYHYAGVTAAAIERITAEHLAQGRAVTELLATPEQRKTAVKLSK